MVVVSRQLWFEAVSQASRAAGRSGWPRDSVRRVLAELAQGSRPGRKPGDGRPADRRTDQDSSSAKATSCGCRSPITARSSRCRSSSAATRWRISTRPRHSIRRPTSLYAVSPPPRDWDGRRVQTYLEEYNRHMLQILTIHEAYPGHYVQLEYSNRCPSLIRQCARNGVFAEGWAVYTEQMMLDEGYGDGDLSLRLHQLKFYLRAVINAILDHQMHCGDMTDERGASISWSTAASSPKRRRWARFMRAKQSSSPAIDVLRRSDGVLSAAASGAARAGRCV